MKYLPLLSLSLLPALLSALTIGKVVQKTIEEHPKIQIKKEGLYTEKELLSAVQAGYLPSLDLSYSIGPESTKTVANYREQVNLTRQEASVTLTQNIFTGFGTMYGVKQQKALISSADDGVAESANNLALEAASAYINVLKNKALYEISQENVATHKKFLKQIKEKVDAGVERASDYKQALSRYEGAQSANYLTEQNYINAISSFKRIYFGEESVDEFEKPLIGAIPADTKEELVAMALDNNPTLQVSRDDVKVAKAALNRSYSPYYPSADIQAQAFWDKNVNGVSTSGVHPDLYEENSGYNALLIIKYNIFNGLADSAQQQANRHRLLKQTSTLADSEYYIKAYAEIAWQTFELTTKQLVHIDNTLQASAETLDNYKKEHELGRRSVVDLLNMELEYNTARNSKVTAEYDRLAAYYQILSYTGKMLEQLDVVVK